eukprot:gnl/TRDRNA2_/TRDRNA2_80787_c0_seq1.p1 gnl/TRDRNA2_/TRDRNA2_80787_c0~~gnl/TRDRNA2_/TRDRNA2_80787_c0_seq1.p1  ORF type:complete len:617 (+),score=82.57 gnl/TRDRNA2_/TRDRNA2_80787_c0_seq1:111-1853(+)
MEDGTKILLAADILKDHFGGVVERVGTTLLERGELSLQDIIRFLQADGGKWGDPRNFTEEPLGFKRVRNALLVLVQHGCVSVRPDPRATAAAGDEAARAVPQLYEASIHAILTRARYPQFLEYVRTTRGDMAYNLLFVVLKFGRVSASVAIAQAHREMAEQAARKAMRHRGSPATVPPTAPRLDELEQELHNLSNERYIRAISPFIGSDSQADKDWQPVDRKRKRDAADDGATPAASTLVEFSADAASRQAVYCCDVPMLNLCLCKHQLVRYMEAHVGSSMAAQAVSALLSGTAPPEEGQKRVATTWMDFESIHRAMEQIPGGRPGRDPARDKEKLRKLLDLLSSSDDSSDSLVKKRVVEVTVNTPSIGLNGMAALDESSRGRSVGRSRPRGAADAHAQAGYMTEQQFEWAVDWVQARRVVLRATFSLLIRDQFGPIGLRIYNLLNENQVPQKLDENQIFSACMVPANEGREVLNAMVRSHIVQLQEVPKGGLAPLGMNFWLYYVNRNRLETALLRRAFHAILNLRIRFREESARTAHLESRPELSAEERSKLNAGRRTEDILEQSFLALDAVILAYRHF